MKNNDNTALVYSSETGRVRTDRKVSVAPNTGQSPSDGYVRLRREVKGRGGGTVIVITGIPLADPALRELAGILKKRCGCGGTAKNGTIEIQGDHRDALLQELHTRGYRVKLGGG